MIALESGGGSFTILSIGQYQPKDWVLALSPEQYYDAVSNGSVRDSKEAPDHDVDPSIGRVWLTRSLVQGSCVSNTQNLPMTIASDVHMPYIAALSYEYGEQATFFAKGPCVC